MRKITLPLLFLAFTLTGCGSDFKSAITSDPGTVSAAGPVFTKKSFINQIGPIPETTILTPTADGDYRVSIYLEAAGTATPSNFATGVSPAWTDDNGPTSPDFPPFAISGSIPGIGNGQLRNQMTINIHVKGGTPIKLLGLQGGDSINKYSVFATIESLQ